MSAIFFVIALIYIIYNLVKENTKPKIPSDWEFDTEKYWQDKANRVDFDEVLRRYRTGYYHKKKKEDKK